MQPPASLLSADPQYPLGRFIAPAGMQSEDGGRARREAVEAIADLPTELAAALAGLSFPQLDTPYRDGGWTLRQLAHHVADSHINAYTRLRLALTEDWPTIKPYDEALWAELADARTMPVEASLNLLVPLHQRWVTLLRSLDEAAWQRGYIHPESGRTTVAAMTVMYSWHGRHHTAQALALRVRQGW